LSVPFVYVHAVSFALWIGLAVEVSPVWRRPPWSRAAFRPATRLAYRPPASQRSSPTAFTRSRDRRQPI